MCSSGVCDVVWSRVLLWKSKVMVYCGVGCCGFVWCGIINCAVISCMHMMRFGI